MPVRFGSIDKALVIGVTILFIGLFSFWYITHEDTFPKGSKVNGQTYIVRVHIPLNYSSSNDRYYNATGNFTLIPTGRSQYTGYHMIGDVRAALEPDAYVLLETKWNSSRDLYGQDWKIEKYYNLDYLIPFSIYLVIVGCIMIIIIFFTVGEDGWNTGRIKLGYSLIVTPVFFVGYFIESVIKDPYVCCVSGLLLLPTLVFTLFFNKAYRKYSTTRKPINIVLGILPEIIFLMLLGFVLGAIISSGLNLWGDSAG